MTVVGAMAIPDLLPVLEIRDVEKAYRSLRPLRLKHFTLDQGERAAIVGLDESAAEVLTNLLVGAHLPDKGQVCLLGRDTASIASSDEWLQALDRVGIQTDRSILLEGLTVLQNLAVPLTLEIEPVPRRLVPRLSAMAAEAGIDDEWLSRPVATVPAQVRTRVRLARALALDPTLLVLEHATASLRAGDVEAFGRLVDRSAGRRRLAILALTTDVRFAHAIRARCFTWQPSTGMLRPKSRMRSWLG